MLDTSECEDYLAEVRLFAEQKGLSHQLQEKLDYLDNYSNRESTRCKLYKDFAP